MEVKRQLDVLDQQLAKTEFIAGDDYTIADIAICLYGALGTIRCMKPLSFYKCMNMKMWCVGQHNGERRAVKRGRLVNRTWGEDNEQLPERHDASDFDGLNC